MKKIFLFLVFAFNISQLAAQANTFLTVDGEVLQQLRLTLDSLRRFPQSEIKAKDREGKEHIYKGVVLSEILKSAGVTLGAQLRGENLTKYVLMKAADGYEVVFSLAETDPNFNGEVYLVAYSVDGKELPKGEGPFRMVVPHDKKPARWIRELTAIKVIFAKD